MPLKPTPQNKWQSSGGSDFLEMVDKQQGVLGGIGPDGVPYGTLASAPEGTVSNQVIQNGLIAQYRILPSESSGALVDYSGKGNNATGTVGGVPSIVPGTGGVGFNGSEAIKLPASLNAALTIQVFGAPVPSGDVCAFFSGTGNGDGTGGTYLALNKNIGSQPVSNTFCMLSNNGPTTSLYSASRYSTSGLSSVGLVMDNVDKIYLNGSQTNSENYFWQIRSSAGLNKGVYQLGGSAGQGSGTVDWYTGVIYYALFYNRVLTDAEMLENHRVVVAELTLRGVTGFDKLQSIDSNGLIHGWSTLVCDGDSITAGAGITNSYPSLIDIDNLIVSNKAQGGLTFNGLLDGGPYVADPCYDPTGIRNIVIIWGGINGGSFSQLIQYCNQRRAQGFKVLVPTMIDCTGQDALKNSWNAQLRSEWPNFCDGLIDIAANPNMGADGSSTNSTYFQQPLGIHPTQLAVTDIIAPMFQQAINRAFYQNHSYSQANNYTTSQTQQDVDEYTILSGSTPAQTYTLQSAQGTTGRSIFVKNIGTQPWTIATNGSETIDGASTLTLAAGSSVELQSILVSPNSGGANWLKV